MNKKLLGIFLALVMILTCGVMASCQPAEEPKKESGEMYRTAVTEINVNVSAYITFKTYTEDQPSDWGGKVGNVYEITVSSYGGKYSKWADGTWELGADKLTLTPDNQDEKTCLVDSNKGEAKTYALTNGVFEIKAKAAGSEFTVTLNPETDKVGENTPCVEHIDENEDGKCDKCGEDMPEKPCTTHVDEDGDGKCDKCGAEISEVKPSIILESALSNYGQKAQMKFYSGLESTTGTWELLLSYQTGMDFNYAAGGTFEVDQQTYAMNLMVTDDQANMIQTNQLVVNVDVSGWPTIKYTCELTVSIPQLGILNFMLTIPDPEVHYTVTFDWNYEGSTPVKVVTKTFTDKLTNQKMEYAEKDEDWLTPEQQVLRVPEREGYLFAGWDWEQNPTIKNGISETVYYPGTRQPTWNKNDGTTDGVCQITKDCTVYARWVQPKHIKTEAELCAMNEDLSGWYILDNDITLTQDWTPIGKYYAHYEYIEALWWQHSFNGVFDGNGHKISGLKLTNLAPYGDEQEKDVYGHPIGNANGTVALFGAVANGTIKNLVLDKPVVNIQNYSDKHHAYVSPLVGFTMGNKCVFENISVVDADIDLTLTNVYYIAVAQAIAGHWGGTVTGGEYTGTIDVNVKYTADYKTKGTYIFVGGLGGENWDTFKNLSSNIDINLNVEDLRTGENLPEGASIMLYTGGVGAISAFTENVTVGGNINVDISKVAENKVVCRMGGLSGAQGHGKIRNNNISTVLSLVTNKSENNVLYYGSVIGSYNDYAMWMSTLDRLQYDGGHIKLVNCNSTSTMTLDGEAANLELIGQLPVPADFTTNPILAYILPNICGAKLAEFTTDGVIDWTGFIDAVFGVLQA